MLSYKGNHTCLDPTFSDVTWNPPVIALSIYVCTSGHLPYWLPEWTAPPSFIGTSVCFHCSGCSMDCDRHKGQAGSRAREQEVTRHSRLNTNPSSYLSLIQQSKLKRKLILLDLAFPVERECISYICWHFRTVSHETINPCLGNKETTMSIFPQAEECRYPRGRGILSINLCQTNWARNRSWG